MYEMIAGLHEKLDDERTARRATEVEMSNLLLQRSRYAARVENLEARIEHFKTRGETLETRVENLATQLRNLKAQNENLKVQNENLSNNLRDMEESTIWRLFGPYRRLRAKISELTRSAPEDAKGNSTTRAD